MRKSRVWILIFIVALSAAFALPQPLFVTAAAQTPHDLHIEQTDGLRFVLWSGEEGGNWFSVKLNGDFIMENGFIWSADGEFSLEITDYVQTPGNYVIEIAQTDGENPITPFASHTFSVSGVLEAPQAVAVDNLSLSWDAVANAAGYTVVINGIAVASATDCVFDLSRHIVISAQYCVAVFAVPQNPDLFQNSPQAVIWYEYNAPLAAPKNASIVYFLNTYLSWSPVLCADGYFYGKASDLPLSITAANLEAAFYYTENNFADISSLSTGGAEIALIARRGNILSPVTVIEAR
jgi:hypothetical protein